MNCLLCNKSTHATLTLKDIFWPGEICQQAVCTECRQRFRPCASPRCPGCSRTGKAELCIECQQWQQQYGWHLRHYALYEYNEMMKDYMHRYKFLGDYRLRLVFQAELSKLVRARAGDLVVPIPITARAWQERGFNQVTGLLVPGTYQEVLDAKEKDKPAQSSKTRRERLRTPQPFCLPANLDVVGKRVLLVDDVYTTGRTLYHAASLFKQAGCSRVGSVSLAR